jgi:aminodeoxychorismate synthase component I
MVLEIFPDIHKFNNLKESNAFVPIFTTLPLNSETPLDLFERLLKDNPFAFLLHSGNISPNSRYSYLGIFHEPFIKGNSDVNPLLQLQSLLDDYTSDKIDYLPHFWGGAVGYFGYDLVHLFERLPRTAIDNIHIPDIYIGFTYEVIVFDQVDNILKVIVCLKKDEDYESGVERLKKLASAITSHQSPVTSHQMTARNLKSNMTKAQFIDMVKKTKEYIREGDIFQANISQRFEAEFKGDSWEFYKRLNKINPSPFGGYIDFGDIQIVSASPERFVKVNGRYIETRPIAGTRPRGMNIQNDTALSKELLLNEKERAEHIMLVDLERNDLGRVCKYGTVRVDELMTLESYSHVWHIVSKVAGELRDDVRFIDILKACFPGGTITGCPKVRCMEIIEELEPVRRGIYTGSMGYIGYNGIVDLNIIIRSALVKNGKIYFHAGAGIVADSDPEREYEETLFKAEAIFEALKNE